ncbi:hypothetical protein BDV26DRAFT_197898 [Aspergillus bertholletiae]|uniref:Zn(2)-C6 fungal-type domain-containing protein n=1 Tax=Aspergillus bertholletiae TaxID=1226010 RepID=A0A5N7B8U4_9EURO|nr:hypothetical protein BDV26DRAFT_197898 [Aspergillus bertholletiae]
MSTNSPASPSGPPSHGEKQYLRQRFSSRVCDHCIRRKVKCDLKRPSCSRCLEAGHSCIYSSTRRKPGPTKGSRASRKALCQGSAVGSRAGHHSR